MRKVMKLFVLFAVLAMLFSLAPPSNAGFIRSSSASIAVPPATGLRADGFPRWYKDSNGIRLGVCDVSPTCFVDPTGAERFYFQAIARGATQGGSRMVFTLSLEGAYVTATGLPSPGKETVFARTTVVAQGLPAAGAYTVRHPWGEKTFNVTADPKDGTFNIKNGRTQAGGFIKSFAAPLNKPGFGPFFRVVTPPVGFLGNMGDAAPPQKIVLVPGMLTNVLTMDGPTGRVFTQPKWKVQGKIF